MGDSFFSVPLSEAQSLLETSTNEVTGDVEKIQEKLTEVQDELQKLKVALYARFGRGINLET